MAFSEHSFMKSLIESGSEIQEGMSPVVLKGRIYEMFEHPYLQTEHTYKIMKSIIESEAEISKGLEKDRKPISEQSSMKSLIESASELHDGGYGIDAIFPRSEEEQVKSLFDTMWEIHDGKKRRKVDH